MSSYLDRDNKWLGRDRRGETYLCRGQRYEETSRFSRLVPSAVEGLMTVMGRDKAEIKPGTPRKESESLR